MKTDTVKGWNFQQVLTACCVLVNYHALSSFVLGQGLTEEAFLITDQMLHTSSELKKSNYEDADNQVIKFLIDNKNTNSDNDDEGSNEDEDFDDNIQLQHSLSQQEHELEEETPKRFKMHRANRINKYVGFQAGKENIHNMGDFNWEEHVYSILLKFIPDYAEAQNQQFVYAF